MKILFGGNRMMGRRGRDMFGGCYDYTRRDMMKARTEHWLRKGGQGKGGRDTSDVFDASTWERRNHRQSEAQSPTWEGLTERQKE